MTTRIATLNIRHGGSKFSEALGTRLLGYDAGRNGIDLLIGDFNTGNNDLDKDPRGAKFIGPEMPGRLIASGYTDRWRSLHSGVREYSWYSRPGDNGFRLDYIFAASNLAQHIGFCEFDHAPRMARETDHSGLVTVVSA